MTSSTLVKGALGLGAASATATGVAYANGVFSASEELISKLIKTSRPDKREITATDGNDANWKEAWKRYREDNRDKNPNEDLWRLEGWTKPASGNIDNTTPAISSFISECKSRLSHKASGIEDASYKEVLRYCTRDTLVKDLIIENIAKDGKQLLQDGDTEGWNSAWQRYVDANKVKEKGKDKWKLSDWGSTSSDTTISTNFKNTCGSKSTSKAHTIDNEDYKDVVSWCTK
ncbi:hypothetical protein HF1_02810 [Mycoplasma haemofelis str. Langford 1]|uniref:Lipoprotein n=1 Tax=Mycoplasma haemofelis (strain Langford 1) TaxID=941640 RepID=E8ZGL8_MYCHL|nr:hypothetical protein [Mycoplasma haemofelis]CBY92289.1 hypothetical protein HF1_02810 [Mycoplasma haemofelis str. Langford 1]